MLKGAVIDPLVEKAYLESLPQYFAPHLAAAVRPDGSVDRVLLSDLTGLKCLDESLTDQSASEDSDINVMVRRFGVSEVIARHPVPLAPEIVDQGTFEPFDFQAHMNIVAAGVQAFSAQPASVREEFGNDPALFVKFFQNPANRARALELGLIQEPVAPTVPEPQRVVIVEPAKPAEEKK